MKIILISLFIIFYSDIVLSQNHFVSEGSNWYFSIPDIQGNPLADYTYYEYLKDTLVEEENCRFIHSSKEDHIIILEEEDKVYYYDRDRFNLLYDFGVNVNDTIYLDMLAHTFLMSPADEYILIDTILSVKSIVREIDSIAIDDYYLRKIFVDIFPDSDILEYATWPSGFEYYEFLGYTYYGIIPLLIKGSGPDINTNRNLRCYSDLRFFHMNIYWQQFGVGCDFIITSIMNPDNAQTVMVYPNPVKDILEIKVGDNHFSCQIKLIDSMGRSILSEEYISDSYEFQLGNLEPGLYLLILKSDKSVFQVIKIIKI